MSPDTAYLAYDYARFYDWNYQGFLDDLPCYVTLARRYGPQLLELACGTGRLTIPLAREGFTVTGLDLSPEMLRIAARKLDREPPAVRERVRLLQGDMSDFALSERYDLAFIPASSLFHLHTREQQASCLACLRRHLASDGAAVVDLTPADRMANQAVGKVWEVRTEMNPETGKMTRELNQKLSLDRSLQRVTVEHTYIETEPDGRERSYVFQDTYRWVREEEMLEVLREVGFTEIGVFGSYDFQPLTESSQRMIFVAQ